MEMVSAADLKGYDGVIAAGGDGTLFEVVNGYFRNQSSARPPLGVVPIGTGNAFARDLGLKTGDVERAVDLIVAGRSRGIDVAKFTTGGQTHHYLNILGWGFVADVGELAHRLKLFGNASYTLAALLRMISLSSYRMTLEIDGRTIERENVFCEISNTRYTSNFLIAPDASIDDGLLDVVLLGKATRRRLLGCFPKIYSGEHIHMEEVEVFTGRHIAVRTDEPKRLAPDGEILGHTPVTVECLHRAVQVFAADPVDPG
jgi:diacylglycerol kinase (ATP)